jgi:type IV pilus assembly protein PilY1
MQGWYMDLLTPASGSLPSGSLGERVVSEPTVLSSGAVIFETFTPASTASCATGGDGWIMEVDALSGTPLAAPTWDINKDGKVDKTNDMVNGQVPSGMKSPSGFVKTPVIAGIDNSCYQVNGSQLTATSCPVGSSVSGRTAWRQLQ